MGQMRLNIDKIDEFFKLLPESFAVDPIQWWAGLVMCGPGWAQKPGLGLGFGMLGLHKT